MKVALAKGAYRMAQQVQTVVDSTVFGGSNYLMEPLLATGQLVLWLIIQY